MAFKQRKLLRQVEFFPSKLYTWKLKRVFCDVAVKTVVFTVKTVVFTVKTIKLYSLLRKTV